MQVLSQIALVLIPIFLGIVSYFLKDVHTKINNMDSSLEAVRTDVALIKNDQKHGVQRVARLEERVGRIK